jgi:DNA-binding response OmpR family regulator
MASDFTQRPRHRLLVAEDDYALREMLVALLRADGYEVEAVSNGLELLNAIGMSPKAGSRRFDLVISDVRMPGASGPRVFSRLGYGPDIPPVLFMTAFGDAELSDEVASLGALAVLEKPIDFDELRAFIRSYLARHCN